jgi:hypothetical protein
MDVVVQSGSKGQITKCREWQRGKRTDELQNCFEPTQGSGTGEGVSKEQ